MAFPLNARVFRQGSAALPIGARVRLFIPWRSDLLRKLIATMKHLQVDVAADARKLMTATAHSKGDLESFLFKIDALCMLANMGHGIADLVAEGIKQTEMTSGELLGWLVNSRVEMAGDVATLAIPAPEKPKQDFKFFIRHTLGPWTPSYWVSVYEAIKSGDSNIYLYGPASTQWRAQQQIRSQAEGEIERLQKTIAAAQRQLAMSFYRASI